MGNAEYKAMMERLSCVHPALAAVWACLGPTVPEDMTQAGARTEWDAALRILRTTAERASPQPSAEAASVPAGAVSDLPPLPESTRDLECEGVWNGAPRDGTYPVWDQVAMQNYARAAIKAAIASHPAQAVSVPDIERELDSLIVRGGDEAFEAAAMKYLARHRRLVMVPSEPTDDMLIAGQEAWATQRHKMPRSAIEDCDEANAVYAAMLAAAPSPPQQEKGS